MEVDENRTLIEEMREDEGLMQLWKNYQKRAPYSEYIVYNDLFNALIYVTDILAERIVLI